MTDPALTFQWVAAELRPLGLEIQSAPGEYRVNYRQGGEATSYYTDDLADALATGRMMAEHAPAAPLPPLGPTGRRYSRRGTILLHNRKLAVRRRALSRAPAGKGK